MRDIELELIAKHPEPFPETPVNALEVMESDRQAHIHQDFFERAERVEDLGEVKRIGRLMFNRFGIDLSAD